MHETQINSFLYKVRRTRVRGAESQLADLTGMELSGGYQVASQFPVASGEADIYTASKDDKEFILKYHRGITEISSGFWLEDSIPARLAAAKEAAREKLNAILTGDDAGIRDLSNTVKKTPPDPAPAPSGDFSPQMERT
ncbi:hypothetical protein [Succinimonas sp.]|uniref:hypothetical protein n=1 Tax=Succinimonas sp. TaxID=1936151 RepID=UPI00386F8471